jgi:hypothetical protein
MPSIKLSGSVSTDEVAKVVVSKLGPGYPVKQGDSNSFRVGKGIFTARVKVHTGDQTTTIKTRPTGLSVLRIINYVIARKVITALKQSELQAV